QNCTPQQARGARATRTLRIVSGWLSPHQGALLEQGQRNDRNSSYYDAADEDADPRQLHLVSEPIFENSGSGVFPHRPGTLLDNQHAPFVAAASLGFSWKRRWRRAGILSRNADRERSKNGSARQGS